MSSEPRLGFRGNSTLVFNDQLSRGWGIGPKTAYFIGKDRFDWRGAASSVTVSVFPAPSDRALRTPPGILGDLDTGRGVRWEFSPGSLQVEVDILTNDQWNPALRPCWAAFKTVQLFDTDNLFSDPRWYRVQINLRFDFSAPRRDLVWWQQCSKASAGLPSLGKRR